MSPWISTYVASLAVSAGCSSGPDYSVVACEGTNSYESADVIPVSIGFSQDRYLNFELMRLGPDNADPRFAGQITRVMSYRMNFRDMSILLLASSSRPDVTMQSFYQELAASGQGPSSLDLCATSADGRQYIQLSSSGLRCFDFYPLPRSECVPGSESSTPLRILTDSKDEHFGVGTDPTVCSSATVMPGRSEGCPSELEQWTAWPCVATGASSPGDRFTEDGVRYCCCPQ